MSTYLFMMGWNEILARIFDGFESQQNISPEWLINPATKRRLKLDQLYPEIGISVRFVGLNVKGRGRKSDWEELEDASRDEVRQELCRLNGVDLILLNPYDPFPPEQLKRVNMALGKASRRIAMGGRFKGKARLMEQLSRARGRADEIRRRVNKPEDLTPYAELWRDREARQIDDVQKPRPSSNGKGGRKRGGQNYKVGKRVEHQTFGPGVVTRVEAKDSDVYVTVRFITAGERTFMASLLGDKMATVGK